MDISRQWIELPTLSLASHQPYYPFIVDLRALRLSVACIGVGKALCPHLSALPAGSNLDGATLCPRSHLRVLVAGDLDLDRASTLCRLDWL